MKKILILGAGFLQAYVIRKAKEIGYYTIAVDANPNAIGFQFADYSASINIVDEQICLEFAKNQNIDGVLTAATDYGVLTASYIAQELGLPGIKCETARLIKNKYRVRKRLIETHADDMEQAFEISDISDIKRISSTLQYPVMVKPCDGSGSRGASKVENGNQLEEACALAIRESITHKAIVEPFIVGQEYGAESFVYGGQIYVLAVMKKWMTDPPYYAELGHSVPCELSTDIEQKIISSVQKTIQALGINFGAVNMDLLLTKNGNVHIIDIGARMGGNLIGSHVIPLGTGYDYMANLIRASVSDAVDLVIQRGHAVATRLLVLTPGIVSKLPNFLQIERHYGVTVEHHLMIGDQIKPYRTNLDGCGYIIACSNSLADAESRVVKALEAVNSQMSFK